MNDTDFQNALSIVSQANDCKVNFNVPNDGSYTNAHKLVIIDCNAHTIRVLVAHGFSLFLKEGVGLLVDKI